MAEEDHVVTRAQFEQNLAGKRVLPDFRDDVRPLLQQGSSHIEAPQVGPLKDLERRAIVAALDSFGGNRTKAAEALGIGRRTLQNKLKLYGMAEDDPGGEV